MGYASAVSATWLSASVQLNTQADLAAACAKPVGVEQFDDASFRTTWRWRSVARMKRLA